MQKAVPDFSAHSNCETLDKATHSSPSPLMNKLGFGAITPTETYEGLLRFESEEITGSPSIAENKNIEAGWTYFGQLMAHDLTTHREFSNDRPYLRLHSLYGMGPKANGFLYEFMDESRSSDPYAFRGVKFGLAPYTTRDRTAVWDVPRLRRYQGLDVPLMGDIRNDENFVLSQLHCLFLRFHNRVAEYLYNPQKPHEQLFKETQQAVTWTYQYIILNEYLPKLLKDKNLAHISLQDFKIINPQSYPQTFLTPEFIVAALRIGHSQVRQFYKINDQDQNLELYGLKPKKAADLRGFKQDKRRHAVDWSLFFNMSNGDGTQLQFSRPIDLMISTSLGGLPFMPKKMQNLGQLNLKRSRDQGLLLPKARLHEVSTRCGIDTIKDLDAEVDAYFVQAGKFTKKWLNTAVKTVENWPLWAFILLEAQIKGTALKIAGSRDVLQTLGPLGSQIFAEQLLWILLTDEAAYLHTKQNPGWKPTDTLKNYIQIGQQFGMADIVAIAENGIPRPQ